MTHTVAPLLMVLGLPMLAGAQDERAGQESGRVVPQVSAPVTPVSFDGDLAALPKVQGWTEGMPFRVATRQRPQIQPPPLAPGPITDPVRQQDAGGGHLPAPLANFAGIGATSALCPDVSGDVGPNHHVQMVNTAFAVYSKSGALLAGPSAIKSLWAGFGGAC